MVEVIIKGRPKEIAALVLELQERQPEKFIPCDSDSEGTEPRVFVPETADGPCVNCDTVEKGY